MMRTNHLLLQRPENQMHASQKCTPEKNHSSENQQSDSLKKTDKKLPKYSQNQFQKENSIPQNSKLTSLPSKILYPETFSGIRINRGVMLEWLLDACSSLMLSWEIYWCAVQILDFLILECKSVNLTNIHIVGGCCLFLAIKARHRYSWKKLTLQDLLEKVLHNNFKKNQVIEIEAQIMILIGSKGQKSKHFSTVYDENIKELDQLPKNAQTEVFRKLVLLWINPNRCLDENHISYTKAFEIMKNVTLKREQLPELQQIEEFFIQGYSCKNLIKSNRKISKIPF